ncbi:iron-containing redox enzyme family protein [Nocardioides sp. zg-ZUI104]|uniref:iron-containing redox enzyme family protein n=1 Tax=Nocardioides faecalis TaxID=2803858 RepID=UPI001BD0C840|nr:iron-containing redox enzyme family protein [Nocardioides faecalis]MBS4751799.1 iron-containing redox enzyme family protein [Nocardioides faecalis]
MRALLRRTDGPRAVPELEGLTLADPLTDRDFQLALWMLYELHYRGFDDVDPAAEWDPLLLLCRAGMERVFEEAVRALVAEEHGLEADQERGESAAERVVNALVRMTASEESSLAEHLELRADRDEFCHYLAQRAVYHLRESDPQSFVLPRIGGAAKVALAELQYDEYGSGRADRLHQALYADALESLGMPTDLEPYLARATGATLASVNLMSLFALNRRLRGAAMGHLAAFEATSSLPCGQILRGAQRLGLPEAVADYYDEHVEADAVHEQLAIRGICGPMVAEDPSLAADVVLGAAACLSVDGLAGRAMLEDWAAQRHETRAAG